MRIIDPQARAKPRQDDGWMALLRRSVERIARKGPSAEDMVVDHLSRVLDNQYTIVRKVKLDDASVIVPMVLVGPSGARVIQADESKGIYRAHEENWEKMDDRSKKYKAVKPNLLRLASLMAQAVEANLKARGYNIPEVEPVLVFTDPGIHIDSLRPIARLVQVDGLGRFAAGLAQHGEYLDPESVQRIADGLSGPAGSAVDEAASPGLEERDVFSFKDDSPKAPSRPAVPKALATGSVPVPKKFNFSKRQWIILSALLAVNILILAGLVIVVLISS